MELQGQHASIGACISTGIVRLLPVLGVAILQMLAIAGGFIAIIIPGLIVYCMLYVATQASVLERPGIVGALKRSRELTDGHKMEIFGIVVVMWLIFDLAGTKLVETLMLPDAGNPAIWDQTIKRLPAYLYVDLDNVAKIVNRVVQTLDRNPQILIQVLKTVDTAVTSLTGQPPQNPPR